MALMKVESVNSDEVAVSESQPLLSETTSDDKTPEHAQHHQASEASAIYNIVATTDVLECDRANTKGAPSLELAWYGTIARAAAWCDATVGLTAVAGLCGPAGPRGSRAVGVRPSQLGLPKALSQTGWIGIGVLALAAVVAVYTGKIVVKSLYAKIGEGRLNGYPDIGRAAFGSPGFYAVQFFHKTTLLGVCTIFLILAGLNFAEVLEPSTGLNAVSWTLITGAAVWIPMVLFKNMSEISLMSLFGVLASAICVIVVIVLSFVDLASDQYTTPPYSVAGDVGSFFTGFATMTFAFGGNAVYPHVEESMRDRSRFGRALTISMVLVSCMYLPIAVVAYAVYGNDVQSPVLLSLPDSWATDMASMIITAHVILAYPIPMTAVVLEFEPLVYRFGEYVRVRLNLHATSTHVVEWTARTLFRTLMVGMTLAVAATVPYFDKFMELLGAVCNCALVFVLPVIFHWKLYGFYSQTMLERIWGIFVVAAGLTAGVIGGYGAIEGLIAAFNDP